MQEWPQAGVPARRPSPVRTQFDLDTPILLSIAMRRKITVKAHDRQLVLIKKDRERIEHVWMKALLWALYLPQYPDVQVEVSIGDRYKPDLVARDAEGSPLFWGEAGQVGVQKVGSLLRRFPTTHFAWAKWDSRLAPYAAIIDKARHRLGRGNRPRPAPIDLIAFPADSVDRFIAPDGQLTLTLTDCTVQRLTGDAWQPLDKIAR